MCGKHCYFLFCFNLKKNAAESHRLLSEAYPLSGLSAKMCEFCFRRFKDGDFDVSDKERPRQPKKYENTELLALLDENSAQALKEFE